MSLNEIHSRNRERTIPRGLNTAVTMVGFRANHSLALCEFSLLCGKVLTDLAPGSGLRGGGGLP